MQYEGRTQSHIKLDNQRIMLELLGEKGPMSRAEIAKFLQSSKPTVSKNIEDLLEKGLVVETGKADNLVGKKGTLVDLNHKYGYVLAMDLSKNVAKAVLADLSGTWVAKSFKTMDDHFEMVSFVDSFLEDNHHLIKDVLATVVSYPGVVGHNDGYYLTNAQMKERLLRELIEYLKGKFSFKPIVKNDVNLAVLAQKQEPSYQIHGNLYYISGDLGIGSGIILNHELYEGDRNAAGEIGFIMPREGKGYETMEERISIGALLKRYGTYKDTRVTYEDLKAAVAQEEAFAVELLEEAVETMAVAITNVSSILDITHVVVAGRLFDLSPDFLPSLMDKTSKMTPFETRIYKSQVVEPSLKGAITIGLKQMMAALL